MLQISPPRMVINHTIRDGNELVGEIYGSPNDGWTAHYWITQRDDNGEPTGTYVPKPAGFTSRNMSDFMVWLRDQHTLYRHRPYAAMASMSR